MRFCFAGMLAIAALPLASTPNRMPAQSARQTPLQTTGQSSQQPPAQASAQPEAKGQVIFSRSTGEDGETVTQTGAAVAQPVIKQVKEPVVEDAERRALTFTDLDLDVHLRPAEQQIAVRALLTVRNDSKAALAQIPLQISSSLSWERIRAGDHDVAFTVATLNSDTDHTGQLHEAAVPLVEPLAPGETAKLDVSYSGAILQDAKRLLAVGTPGDVALHSDWDEVSAVFTGLRGFGNVVWYPVSSVPAILGDGARVFDEISRQKLRLSGARFRLRLANEFAAGQAPNVALVNGRSLALAVTDFSAGGEIAGVATADSGESVLGFEAPSLFVAGRNATSGTDMNLLVLPEDANAANAWTAAATAVAPFLQGWLGARPAEALTLLDLPDAHDAPFETGALLAIPIRPGPADQLQGVLAHAMSHAYLRAGPAPLPMWLDEGVANFMGTLWIEKQQGRDKALEWLESGRRALAIVEPASPGESAGEPIEHATSPVYYRTKAVFVLWMLRDMVGEPALSAALRGLEPTTAPHPGGRGGTERNGGAGNTSSNASSQLFEGLLEQADGQRDLKWFFSDWIDADRGLPDLAIEGVFPNSTAPDSSLVAVNVANNGYAGAEAALTVRSDLTSVTQRILIPARSKASRRILIQGKPIEVQLNDGSVPETQASVHVTKLTDAPATPNALK